MSWMVGMPNLGHTMEEGKVSEWLKRPGDPVRKGEIIAVVESDKASFDIESPADGVLARIDAVADTTVAVGTAIGWVVAPGEQLDAAGPGTPPAGAAAPVPASPASAAGARDGAAAARGRISPAARALAESEGLDWQSIEGSGDGGMITRDDVREAIAAARGSGAAPPAAGASPSQPAAAGVSPSRQAAPAPAANTAAMRRAIAQATQQAWTTIPHVPLLRHAVVDELQARHPAQLTAAIVRASALALQEHPSFNGWYLDGGFQRASTSDMAVAVATAGGLMMPVVKGAQDLSVAQVHERMGLLAQQAREGRLDGSALLGASFAVSTLGRWGVEAFAPIISAPQVAILGVGGVARRPRETPTGGIGFVSAVGLTLVFDHRANDGVEAAKFLATLVACLEQPDRLQPST